MCHDPFGREIDMVLPHGAQEANAFEQVVLPHLGAGYNLARWLTGDATLAQDVVQDAAVRALSYFGGYRGGDGKAWFLRIVRNVAMTALGKPVLVSLDVDIADLAVNIADMSPGPEQDYARLQDAAALDRAMVSLPVELRECLILRELEECSYRDIAEITGTKIGTVMSRLWRARQSLARTLGDRL